MSEARRPTIFLVVHLGLVARFLLRTDVLPALKAAGTRVVVLTPDAGDERFRSEFEEDAVVVEPLDGAFEPKSLRFPRLALNLHRLRIWGLGEGHRSPAFQDKYEAAFLRRHREATPRSARAIDAGVRAMWRSRNLRRLVSAAERRLVRPSRNAALFERYRPDLVVTTGLGYTRADLVLLREARRHGVRTAAAILSWDHPTSLGYRAEVPDLVIAWSERMAEQVVRHHDVPRSRIAVGGVPHFDRYLRPGALLDREELCAELGLDPERRIVFFPTGSPREHAVSIATAKALAAAVGEDGIGAPAQLVIRLHPNFVKSGQGDRLERFGYSPDQYNLLAESNPQVHLNLPEASPGALRLDLGDVDTIRLGSLVANCNVLVNVFSTTTLEACLADRPVVLVDEHAHLGGTPPERSMRPFASYVHQEAVLASNAVRVAKTLDELAAEVSSALADPLARRAARREVAEAECGYLDGRSGERVGRLLAEVAAAASGR